MKLFISADKLLFLFKLSFGSNRKFGLMKKYLLIILCFLMCPFSYAQQIITHSEQAYLYKINEAHFNLYSYKYLKKNIATITQANPIDTIDYFKINTFKTSFKKTGTYLLVYIDKNLVQFQIIANFPWKTQTVFYPVDGGILVTDSNNIAKGKLDLHLESEKLIYDTIAQTYVYTRIDQNGTLSISDSLYTQKIKLNTNASSYKNWDYNSNYTNTYAGFIVTNKPIYKHGDTLKLKVYLCYEYGKPYKKNILLYIADQRKVELKPISPGAYVYEYIISDSLKLDQNYSINIYTNNGGYTGLTNTFKVEDYKLDEIEYNFRPLHSTIYNNDSIYFVYEAFDKNHNPAFDAEVEIVALPYYVPRIYANCVYFPDTLFHGNFKMLELNNNILKLPGYLKTKYPADYALKIMATCKNSNNELKKIETVINIYHGPKLFETYMSNYHIKFIEEIPLEDSITVIKYFDNNSQPQAWKIHKTDSVKIDPLAANYMINWGGQLKSITVDQSLFHISLSGKINVDSLHFTLHNPAQVPVNMYCIKNELKELLPDLNSQSMRLKKNEQVNIYYEYTIGTNRIVGCRSFMIDDKNIFIKTDLPDKVYPGQKSTLNISSFNYKNQALENTNLTVVSVNAAFNQNNIPHVPLFGKQMSNAATAPKGYLTEIGTASYSLTADSNWIYKFGLENNLFYMSLISKNKVSIYREFCDKNVGSIVKIVGHLGSGTYTQPIYVEENGQIVYYNRSETDHIKATGGVHQYRVRFNNFLYDLPPVMVYNDSITYVVIKPALLNKKTEKIKIKEPTDEEQLKIRDQFIVINKNDYLSYPSYFSNHGQNYCLPSLSSGDIFLGPFMGSDSITLEQFYENKTQFITMGISKKKRNYLYKHRVDDKGFENYKVPIWEKYIENPFAFNIDLSYYYQNYSSWSAYHFDLLYSDFKTYQSYGYSYQNSKFNQVEFISNVREYFPAGTMLVNLAEDTIYKYRGHIQKFNDLDPGSYRLIYVDKNLQPILQDSFYVPLRGTLIKLIDSTAFFKKKINEDINNLGLLIKGKIVDSESLDPIPFANIVVEKNGKLLEGTHTDIDGQFMITIPNDEGITVKFACVGYNYTIYTYEMLKANVGNVVIKMDGSKIELKEFVLKTEVEVIDIKKYNSLGITQNSTVAYGVYTRYGFTGLESINQESSVYIDGVAVNGSFKTSEKDLESSLFTIPGVIGSDKSGRITNLDELVNSSNRLNPDIILGANSIRSFFADNAIWQPNLITQNNGSVSCEIKFPENITSWNTYILAMHEDGLSGQMSLQTQSYKPVVASLYLPDFVVEGDSFEIVNKVMNYTSIPIATNNILMMGNVNLFEVDSSFRDFFINKPMLAATAGDSITLSFSTQLSNGYLDGEKRVIPVYKKGINVHEGKMFPTWKNITIPLDSLNAESDVELEIYNGFEELILKESNYLLFHYKHACNEQLSSKLIVAICASAITNKGWKKDIYDLQIENMIRLLRKNQNERGGWSWWGNGKTNVFMTLKVAEALKLATEKGYEVKLKHSFTNVIPQLLEDAGNRDDTLAILKMAGLYQIPKESVFDMKSIYTLSVPTTDYQKLLAMEIRQLYKLPYDITELMDMKHETLFGNYYWGHNSYYLYDNATYITSMALDILKRENVAQDTLVKVIGYMMEKRIDGHFFNTMASAKMSMFFSDYVSNISETPPAIVLNQKDTFVIKDKFKKITLPKNVSSVDVITDKLIYVGYSQQKSLPYNAIKEDLFSIKNEWIQNEKPVTEIESGKFVTLHTRIIVKKDAKFMSVEIPIPAGCTYAEKNNNLWYSYEVHREYFKDRIAIYYENLPVGTYHLYFKLEPRFKGVYSINNSLIENMYFPQLNGYNALTQMKVK